MPDLTPQPVADHALRDRLIDMAVSRVIEIRGLAREHQALQQRVREVERRLDALGQSAQDLARAVLPEGKTIEAALRDNTLGFRDAMDRATKPPPPQVVPADDGPEDAAGGAP